MGRGPIGVAFAPVLGIGCWGLGGPEGSRAGKRELAKLGARLRSVWVWLLAWPIHHRQVPKTDVSFYCNFQKTPGFTPRVNLRK